MYLFERQSQTERGREGMRERERAFSHLLVDSPNGLNAPGLGQESGIPSQDLSGWQQPSWGDEEN